MSLISGDAVQVYSASKDVESHSIRRFLRSRLQPGACPKTRFDDGDRYLKRQGWLSKGGYGRTYWKKISAKEGLVTIK